MCSNRSIAFRSPSLGQVLTAARHGRFATKLAIFNLLQVSVGNVFPCLHRPSSSTLHGRRVVGLSSLSSVSPMTRPAGLLSFHDKRCMRTTECASLGIATLDSARSWRLAKRRFPVVLMISHESVGASFHGLRVSLLDWFLFFRHLLYSFPCLRWSGCLFLPIHPVGTSLVSRTCDLSRCPLFRSSILRLSRWTSSWCVCFDFRRSCLGLDFPSIFFLPLSPPSVSVSVSVSRDGFAPDRPSFDSRSSFGSVPSSERDDWGSFGSLDPVWVRSLPISLGTVRFQPVWFGRDGGRPSAKEQLGRPLPTQPWEHRCVQVPAPFPRDGQPIPHRGRRGHNPKTRASPTGHAARVREERSKEKGKEGKTCPENSKRGSDGS